jgi:LMBR1 domain-containing protein 1
MERKGLFVLSAVCFSVLNVYLLFCVVKGNLKIGMRAFCLFSIHPMRKGRTPLNSLIFNCILLLLSSCAVVQFAQVAFNDYARDTRADVIFNAEIQHLYFYNWFFQHNVFMYMLLGWALLSLIYLLLHPRDGQAGVGRFVVVESCGQTGG